MAVICTDAGHGGSASGAAWMGIVEKNLNLRYTTALNKELKKRNHRVFTTRTLHSLIEWTTRPKAQVEFSVPINGTLDVAGKKKNLELELLDPVLFCDTIYTMGRHKRGYVVKIEQNTKKSEIMIGLILEPDDFTDVIIERGIPLNDDKPWIYESGERATQIIES
ncbi:MAG: N-acetylmuramoyl-L-alanine amidase [Chitinispirillaceae bacterium]